MLETAVNNSSKQLWLQEEIAESTRMDRDVTGFLGGVITGSVVLVRDSQLAGDGGLLFVFLIIEKILLIIGHG